MALFNTNLVLEAAPLPAAFEGTPQQLFEAMVSRIRIKSPAGTNFIVIGGSEPSSNQGPWLKDGVKWYVWSDADQRYVPVDVSDSVKPEIHFGDAPPMDNVPPFWVVTSGLQPVSLKYFDGTSWKHFGYVIESGGTDGRPANPAELQRYYDEDIGVEIWWERGAWRTVSGSPGDVKFVMAPTLEQALRFNPGWSYIGELNQALRGRHLVIATKDPGSSPQAQYETDPNVEPRAAHEVWGEDEAMEGGNDLVYPPSLALWCLVKT